MLTSGCVHLPTFARCAPILPSISSIRSFRATTAVPHGLYPFFNKHKKVTDPARQDPDYFEKEAEKLPLNDNYVDSLKMLWEEKIGSERELIFKAQDSLIGNTTDFGLPKLDMSQPRLEYRGLDALENAPECVKRIYSLEHGKRSDVTAAWKKEMMDKVRRDELDVRSMESKVAWATATIRHLTALYEELMKKREEHKPHGKIRKRPSWLAYRTYLLINARRKMLGKLREIDYDAFERVLRELRIVYHIEKAPEHVKTRKAWSEAQLRRRIELEKERQLSALHEKLLDGREQRVTKLDSEYSQLAEEEQRLLKRLHELDVFEGKTVPNVVGKYESSQQIADVAETAWNVNLFYKERRRPAEAEI